MLSYICINYKPEEQPHTLIATFHNEVLRMKYVAHKAVYIK